MKLAQDYQPVHLNESEHGWALVMGSMFESEKGEMIQCQIPMLESSEDSFSLILTLHRQRKGMPTRELWSLDIRNGRPVLKKCWTHK